MGLGIHPHLILPNHVQQVVQLPDGTEVNVRDRSKSASFNAEGEKRALELLTAYGIGIDEQG